MKPRLYTLLFSIYCKLGRLLGRGFAGRSSLGLEAEVAASVIQNKNAIVLDVGANRGDWSRNLLRCLEEGIEKIYAFEPSPVHHEGLTGISGKVELVPMAASDNSGEIVIYGHNPGAAITSVYKRELAHYDITFTEQGTVPCITLDDFVTKKEINSIDMLKLDVEGHELAVLNGARQAFERGIIKAFSFEMGGCNIDSRTFFRDFWLWAETYGFDVYVINPLSKLQKIEGYHEKWESFLTINYLAVKR